jgi:hypothetical protein
MNINLAQTANDAMLGSLAKLLNSGSIELLADTGLLLATLPLGSPAASVDDGGILEFGTIGEGVARAQGSARSARILTARGEEIFSCDVGDLQSDAVVKLNTTWIAPGGPVRIDSFVLAMP